MPGGPMGGVAAGGTFEWREESAPSAKRMSYAEFLVQENLPAAPIPELYLVDGDGQIVQNTRNGWYQIQRIYAGAAGEERAPTYPGSRLLKDVRLELAVKQKEMRVMEELYEAALDGFWFEVGLPQYTTSANSPDSVPITVDVIMHVKQSAQKSYGGLMYKRLKPFDNPGQGRQPFSFITYQRGYYNPVVLSLCSEAISVWNGLWPQTQVRLRLLDQKGTVVAEGAASAGFGPGTCNDMVHPPELMYQPQFRYLMPDEDRKFEGGRLNLNYSRGWYYQFNFTLTLGQLGRLEAAEVTLIGAAGVEGARSTTQTLNATRGPAARTLGAVTGGYDLGPAVGAAGLTAPIM